MKKIFWLLIIILILILVICLFNGRGEKWENIRITDSPGQSLEPVAVWDGSGYGIVWNDTRDVESGYYTDVYFAKIDKDGKKLINDINISNTTGIDTGGPAIAWTGEEYGIIWQEDRKWPEGCLMYFARLDADGNKIGDNVVVASSTHTYWTCSYESDIEWSGSEYGISWRMVNPTYDHHIYFNRLNVLGERQGNDIQISSMRYARAPSMHWMGSGYGMIWEGYGYLPRESALIFSRIDSNGVKQIDNIRVSNTSTSWCAKISSITWNNFNENFGLVWDERDANYPRQIYFTILDQDGNKQIENVMVTDSNEYTSSSSTIAWANRKSEYGIAWNQHNNITGEDLIKFAAFDADGNMKGEIIQISNLANATTTLRSKNPDIIWSGKNYGIFWDDYRDGNEGGEIYFATSYSCWITDVFNNIKDFIIGLF